MIGKINYTNLIHLKLDYYFMLLEGKDILNYMINKLYNKLENLKLKKKNRNK